MGVICVSKEPERCWQAAGWAFRQVLDDVLQMYPVDVDFRNEFEQAKVYDSLSLYALPNDMAKRVICSLREAAEGILAGTMQSGIESQSYGDSNTQAQYKSGLRQLLLVLPPPN